MSAEEVLKSSERSALKNNQFVSHVTGKKSKVKSKKKLASFGAAGFITVMIIVAAMLFGSGNIIPSAISERLIEETDVQYADMVESKKIVLQQALKTGDIPDDTVELLKSSGVLVGYLDENGNFVENNKSGHELVLKKGDEVITAKDFINKVSTDVALYDAINKATYNRAAGYYDEEAKKVFKEIGTSRNNFDSDSDFNEVVDSLMGKGSDININSVSVVEKRSESGESYYEYVENGAAANSDENTAAFIESVRNKNPASSTNDSALNSADTLKVADTISKEQRSSLFYALFMENISKMKAGDGNESKINEAMNYLYTKAETEVVDVKTGELVNLSGTPLESPSLYAILSGDKVNVEAVENYSSDRVLKTIKNILGINSGYSPISSTVASSGEKVKGSVGRYLNTGSVVANTEVLNTVSPTIKSSLVDNSYDTIKGIYAGETLAEGAVNVGKMLAKTSGATAGDEAAVKSYARLNSAVIAMDAEADRINRNPFDITSRNTFLGSIIYRFAMFEAKFSGALSGVKTFSSTINSAVLALLPGTYADDAEGYLTTFGDCDTYATIGAVGTAGCSEIATFDTSTLNDPFNDAGFRNFVNFNTILDSNGTRKIKPGSNLANFIIYNDERKTPLGVVDGGILNSLSSGSGSIGFMSNISEMIKIFLGTSEQDKRVASGAAFVNSSNNTDWQTYKYAQRYVALARVTAMLKQYSSDKTAYQNLEFFEGEENPVVAFLNQYYNVATK